MEHHYYDIWSEYFLCKWPLLYASFGFGPGGIGGPDHFLMLAKMNSKNISLSDI
jgi:hypothetical protein